MGRDAEERCVAKRVDITDCIKCVALPESSEKQCEAVEHATMKPKTYLSEFGGGCQILLEAAEGGIVALEVCACGLAAAAPQIGGHGMRNVVALVTVVVGRHLWLACGVADTGAAGSRIV